jgi:hypothetical protein
MTAVLENWRDFFAQWPADMPRRGIIIAEFGEQMPFSAFWTSPTYLLLERTTPDSLGARTIVLPFTQVAALKITDVVKPKTFQPLGFEGVPVK